MRDYLDQDDLFVYLRMLRKSDGRLFLVVEGESDVVTVERHIDRAVCTVIPGYGKRAVLEAMVRVAVLDDECIALVDSDFGHQNSELGPSNVFTTHYYDRDTDLLLKANLMYDYVAAVMDRKKASRYSKMSDPQLIVNVVISVAACVGEVRWASVSRNLGLDMSDFPIGAIMTRPSVVCINVVTDLAIRRTRDCRIEAKDVQEACSNMPPMEPKRLCNGHDLVRALAVSSQWWARKRIGRREIGNYIRATVRCDVLALLPWFDLLKLWAEARGRTLWTCS